MSRILVSLVVMVAGCARATAPDAAHPLDDRSVANQTRALFDAYDRGDAASLERLIAPGFVLFDNLREFQGTYIVEQLRADATRARSRVCRDETIARGATFVVYTAECVERWSVEAGTSNERVGWNTVTWIKEGGRWRAAHWNWKRGGVSAEREMWNDTFVKGVGFRHEANRLLVETVRDLAPGTAVDLMTGQGRNAIYLASRGWKTTGVDISDVGLGTASEAAGRAGLVVDWIEADVDTYDLGTGRWDLVTMIYAGSDAKLIARAKAATRPGGLFVVEFFLKDNGPMGFARGELAAQFADWRIERDEVVEDVADWSKQRTWLVRFVARKPR